MRLMDLCIGDLIWKREWYKEDMSTTPLKR